MARKHAPCNCNHDILHMSRGRNKDCDHLSAVFAVLGRFSEQKVLKAARNHHTPQASSKTIILPVGFQWLLTLNLKVDSLNRAVGDSSVLR